METEHRICRCNIPANLQKQEMFEKIAEYINRLDPEQCVTDSEYEHRLAVCDACPALIGGLTCKYCGCFVLARAKKLSQNCPMPGVNKWLSGTDSVHNGKETE